MTEIETLTSGQRYWSLAAAIGCTAVTGITMGLTWPLLALILDHQGISGTLIGLSSASQSLAIFATAPLAPRAISRFGLVRTILGCIAMTVAMLVLLGLWRAARIVHHRTVSRLGERARQVIAGNAARGRDFLERDL